jgi:hypothetical protein
MPIIAAGMGFFLMTSIMVLPPVSCLAGRLRTDP